MIPENGFEKSVSGSDAGEISIILDKNSSEETEASGSVQSKSASLNDIVRDCGSNPETIDASAPSLQCKTEATLCEAGNKSEKAHVDEDTSENEVLATSDVENDLKMTGSGNKNAVEKLYEQLKVESKIVNPYSEAIKQVETITEIRDNVVEEASAPPLPIDTIFEDENKVLKEQVAVLDNRPKLAEIIEQELLLIPSTENIKAYTDADLKSRYHNIVLENQEAEVKHFINADAHTPNHYLYELLQNYYRSRINQISSYENIQKLNDEMLGELDHVWQFESHTIEEEGTCEDDVLVEARHDYKTAHYRDDVASDISRSMKQLREVVFETHSLHCYTSEMNRILVENYITEVSNL